MSDSVPASSLQAYANPLDENLYKIDDHALEFMKSQTGIQDTEELKQHILAVQAEAYAVSSLWNLLWLENRIRGPVNYTGPPVPLHPPFFLHSVSD